MGVLGEYGIKIFRVVNRIKPCSMILRIQTYIENLASFQVGIGGLNTWLEKLVLGKGSNLPLLM
jgi:hypothetical protein